MNKFKDNTPAEFYRGEIERPMATQVSDLIWQLKKLPQDMLIKQGFGDGVQLTVYNINSAAPFLEFEEVDDD